MPAVPAKVFQNILRLEEHKGFADTAVAGGLEAFARRWANEVGRSDRSSKGLAEDIAKALGDYASADGSTRLKAVHRAAELLQAYEQNGGSAVPASNGRNEHSPVVVNGNGNGVDKGNGHVPTAIEGFTGYDGRRPACQACRVVVPQQRGSHPLRARPPEPTSPRVARRNATIDSPVTVLRGVQEATARLLKRLGVYTRARRAPLLPVPLRRLLRPQAHSRA